MAAAAPSFHAPYHVPSPLRAQRLGFFAPQNARPSPCPEFFSRRRKRLACSADPHDHRPLDEDNEIRAEISPSVFRSLQAQDSSSSPASSGESLIERNLRKRAKAQQASSSPSAAEEGACTSGLSNLSERQGSSLSKTSGQDLQSSDKGFPPLLEAGEDGLRHGFASSSITAAVWQACPPGCDMRGFHSIDYHVFFFRFLFVLGAAIYEFPVHLEGLSAFSFIGLFFPVQEISVPFLDKEDLMLQWRRAAGKFGKFVDNKDALTAAIEVFSNCWSSKAWAERAASGKATELVMTLTYSTYVYILSAAAGDTTYLSKKLEECSSLLNQSLTLLHGPPLDPMAIWEKALKNTQFALDGRVFVYDHTLIFPCKLRGDGNRAQFGPALEDVQNCLNKEFKDSDLIVLLHRSSESHEEFYILVVPWYWVLTTGSKQFVPMPAFLCMLSCFAVSQFPGAGLDFGFAWEQSAAPLCWASIIASLYFTNNMFPTLIPFPSLGAMGYLLTDFGMVSSRSSLITTVLENSLAPLAVSILLVVGGWAFWGPSQYYLASVVDFRGYVLVPHDLFSYSGILSKLLQDTSVETIQMDNGALKLAASPIVLAGLFGLNFTAFTLFPGLRTSGGYLVKSLLKSKQIANQLNLAFSVLLTLILCTKKPFLGLAWVVLSIVTEADCFVKDDVSDTDLVSSLVGTVLVAAAVAFLIPPLL